MKLTEIAKFCKKHVPSFKEWSDEQLLTLLDFYTSNGFLQAIVVDIEGNEAIAAIGMARPVNDINKAMTDPYYFDTLGNIIFIENAISIMPGAIDMLWNVLEKRLGYRDFIAFTRSKHDGRLSKYPTTKLDHFKRIFKQAEIQNYYLN